MSPPPPAVASPTDRENNIPSILDDDSRSPVNSEGLVLRRRNHRHNIFIIACISSHIR